MSDYLDTSDAGADCSPPLLLLYLSVKGWMLLLEHGATDQVRKLVRQGAALKVLWQYLHCTSSL